MTTIAWPAGLRYPLGLSLQPNFTTISTQSPFSGSEQYLGKLGMTWSWLLHWEIFTPAEARILSAFIAQLRGQANRTKIGPFQQRAPSGTARGALVVDGSNQVGNTLAIRGAIPGRTLEVGDYIEVNNELKIVTVRGVASSETIINVEFEPFLRHSPADGDLVVWDRPGCLCRLVGSPQLPYGSGLLPGYMGPLDLQFSESFT